MPARRRGLLLALAFFGLAVWLTPGQRAHAQPPWQKAPPPPHFRHADSGAGQHRIWKSELKADDIRDTLSKFGNGDAKVDQMLLELLKQFIGERSPKATPEEVDKRARELMADKELRDRVTDAIQKQKNTNPDQWANNGRPPQFTREQINDWLRTLNERGGNGDPFRVPQNAKADPKKIHPFNPKHPNFKPEDFPAIDPKNPPEFDPQTGFPKDPRTGKLFDPRSGKELNPNELQPFNPKNPLFDRKQFPFVNPDTKFDPKTGLPKNENGELFNPRTGEVLDPEEVQPFNPKNPLFDPKRFPLIDPNKPPKFDPETGFPEDPVAGKPFDPRTGRPIDPKNPPRIKPLPDPNEPVNPVTPNFPRKVDQPPVIPPEFPKVDQPDLPNLPDNRKFDPNNPLGLPENQDKDQAAKSKAVETATAIWEKNVGPIDESPAVKKALIDLVGDPETRQMLTDDKGNNIFDSFQKDNGKGENFSDWFGGDGKWEWPKFNWGSDRNDNDRNDRNLDLDFGQRDRDRDWNMGRNRDRWRDSDHSRDRRSGDSSSSGMGSLDLNGMQVPVLALLILLIALVAAVIAWKMRGTFTAKQSSLATAGGDSGWPVDPRDINTREDVVKVFEFLSVMLCGANAKTWTHSTIADELTELAASEPETATKLARLYELARYAPLDEPLTRTELLEARRLACDLAGIDEV